MAKRNYCSQGLLPMQTLAKTLHIFRKNVAKPSNSRFKLTFHCRIPNFVVKFKSIFWPEFANLFVNQAFDCLRWAQRPITVFVYKLYNKLTCMQGGGWELTH